LGPDAIVAPAPLGDPGSSEFDGEEQRIVSQVSDRAGVKVAAVAELSSRTGSELGVSGWHEVSQRDVNLFAQVTGDDQWIHTDPGRASATEFRGTIAHGYYTLSLAPALLAEVVPLDGFAMAVNFGLDKVRFPAPLPVGDRIRMRVGLERLDELPGGATLAVTLTFEREGGEKPVCVAEALYRVFEEEDGR
jgi:acyl dehydratase